MPALFPSSLRPFALAGACLLLCACPRPASDDGPLAIFGSPGAATPLPFEQYPFPIDLALTPEGISVHIPDLGEDRDTGDTPMSDLVATGLAERHGFSGSAGVTFPFEGELDPATLPSSVEASTAGDASAFLLGLSGPHAGLRIPSRIRWRADAARLFVMPHYGNRLLSGEKYAAVVTTKVKGKNGAAVRASDAFREAMPVAESSVPFMRGEARAPHPLFAPLVERGLSAEDIAVATVFTIDRPQDEARVLREAVYAEPLAPFVRTLVFPTATYDLDRLFGVVQHAGAGFKDGSAPHDHINTVINGTVRAPLFINENPGKNGVITFGADGRPLVKGHDDVFFTLVLPAAPADVSAMPLVMYLHGLGGQRSDTFAVANELCRRGYAVVGFDLPFHGSRTPPLPGRDRDNNVTGERYPDGIGDPGGVLPGFLALGITSDTLGLPPLTPMIVRDSLRQGALDGMALLRALLDGEKAPLVDGIATFAGLGFDEERVFWMSESFGSLHGAPLFAMEPRLKAAAFGVGGGGLVIDTLLNSPTYAPSFSIFIYQKLGLASQLNDSLQVDYLIAPPELEYPLHLFQHVVDAADPAAFAPLFARFPPAGTAARSVLFVVPAFDESVPPQAEESLAMSAGAFALRNGEGPELRYGAMDVVDGPVRGNVNGATVGFVQFAPANHGVLTRRAGEIKYEPGFPPWIARPEPLHVDNPTDRAQRTVADFFDSVGEGSPEIRVAQ